MVHNGSSEVKENQVANGRLYADHILTCCVNFNLTRMTTQLYAVPTVNKLPNKQKQTLRNILELICNEPVEFNFRLDHGLNGDVREWLTGPNNVV